MSTIRSREVCVSLPFRLAIAAVLLLSACTAPGAGSPIASPAPTAGSTAAVTDGTGPSGPTGSGAPTASDSGASAEPAAWLRPAGSASAGGTLGSWTLDGSGSDAPWLPASALSPVQVAAGSRLEAGYGDGAAVGAWGAWLAPADDPLGASAVWIGGREAEYPARAAVSIEGIAPGSWVLAVRLDRADGRGDATFYWQLVAS